MKYFSRSVFGVLIGSLCILGYCFVIAYIIISIYQNNNYYLEDTKDEKKSATLTTTAFTIFLINYIILIFCFMEAIISGFFVAGIVKRRSEMMTPWITCALAAIFYQYLRIIIAAHNNWLNTLFHALLLLVVQLLTFLPVSTLHDDIWTANKREEQMEALNDNRFLRWYLNEY